MISGQLPLILLIICVFFVHHMGGWFALVNVGFMPLLLQWSLAKGTGFFYVKGIVRSVINHRALCVSLFDFFELPKIIHVPNQFNLLSHVVEISHFSALESPLNRPKNVVGGLQYCVLCWLTGFYVDLGSSRSLIFFTKFFCTPLDRCSQRMLSCLVASAGKDDCVLCSYMKLS